MGMWYEFGKSLLRKRIDYLSDPEAAVFEAYDSKGELFIAFFEEESIPYYRSHGYTIKKGSREEYLEKYRKQLKNMIKEDR